MRDYTIDFIDSVLRRVTHECHCGASQEQKETYAAQSQFLKTLTSAYQTQFAGQQAILSQLTSAFEPILAGGPSQQGFSAGELAALNSQATNQVGQNYANLQKSLANREAALGGGNAFLPSGMAEERAQELGTSAAQQLGAEDNTINLQNYATGRQNFLTAATALGGVSSQLNPLGYAGTTVQQGNATAQTADQIAAANNAWMSSLGGALGGGLGQGLVGLIPTGGSKGSNG
jgi:hypothetical protein